MQGSALMHSAYAVFCRLHQRNSAFECVMGNISKFRLAEMMFKNINGIIFYIYGACKRDYIVTIKGQQSQLIRKKDAIRSASWPL